MLTGAAREPGELRGHDERRERHHEGRRPRDERPLHAVGGGTGDVHAAQARGRAARGGHCVAPLPTDRRRARCDLALQGSFSVAGKAGANSVRLSGRLRGVALGAGRYWLRAAPRDAAGNAGEAKRVAIAIVRRR